MKLIILLAALLASSSVLADTLVNGYVRSDGTYVAPHYRTEANGIRFDNYSSQGNSNPYTGQRGYESNELSIQPVYNKRESGIHPNQYGNKRRQ